MKKCPFCAEEIQDEAIKCRFCQSFLSMAPGADETGHRDERTESPEPASRRERGKERGGPREREVLYRGTPSWRAFFTQYVALGAATLGAPILAVWIAVYLEASGLAQVLAAGGPLLAGLIALFAVNLYRKSKIFRITTSHIETEYGFLTKKINVLELWRCRDVSYRQSLLDRILGIAHIDVFTTDVTTPHLRILGLPASRQLFERIRDSIEIQRHAKNVVGFVQ